jgi:hypothetical protein
MKEMEMDRKTKNNIRSKERKTKERKMNERKI